MNRPCILIVEDLPSLQIAYSGHLEKAGFETVIAATAEAAMRAINGGRDFQAVLLDLQLPDGDGLNLLAENPRLLTRFPVVVATANASLAKAVEAMQLGAYDFLVKPVAGARLASVISSAVESGQSPVFQRNAQKQRLRDLSPGKVGFIGQSTPMLEILDDIERLAHSKATVFITGQSGTGKEVCAEAIHQQSGRQRGPFIAVNCGAIPENLLESELFGHVKGAFTGAVTNRVGAVQAAHKGTLFLDEICEMPLQLQVKLLRFLQTGLVQRVGSSRTDEVDVRVVCATNRSPEEEVAQGRFREDLYYRLRVIPLHMPPLSERGDDVGLLADEFLCRFSLEEGKHFEQLGPEHRAALAAYNWPGNVRELQNVIRRAVVMNSGPELPLCAIPADSVNECETPAPISPFAFEQVSRPSSSTFDTSSAIGFSLADFIEGKTLDDIERLAIECAIEGANGSLPVAARNLGLSASTLYRKKERWNQAANYGQSKG